MTDFSDCYFCGAVAADLEEHPVIPPEMDPPDARQRTVAVCPTCREKLDRVIEPVVAHLDPDAAEHDAEASDTDGDSAEHDAETGDVDGDSADHDTEASDTDGDSAEHDVEADSASKTDTEKRGGSGDASGFSPESRRILRLLDNREFPVDRGDIVTVATNAYGVAHGEAEAVIDVLIEQGELTEEDGTLHRPE